ncbi:MAG TPA: tRNA-specific adenosine deaminase [Bacteroidetes bacterium]|nr:tRNA-specific adenosine deaminase [Bacteroidota bacterium]
MSNSNSPALDEHQRYMIQAIFEAEKALKMNEVPIGAVVVHQGRIVGRGYNQVESLKDPTAHAEIIAITAACATLENKYLNGCTLYVTLEPCSMCAGALVWSKIDRLVFGATDDKAGACGSILNIAQNKSLNHHVEIIQGVLELDASELLKQFFKSRRMSSNV